MTYQSASDIPRTHLGDYQPPPYTVDKVHLTFELGRNETLVQSTLAVRRTEHGNGQPFVLNGNDLVLKSIYLNDAPVQYRVDSENLTIENPPKEFSLSIRNKINPFKNTSLTGLYVSGNILCTQCEAEGFRKITYFPDRPDILSQYTVKIIASKQSFPILLSNGELMEASSLSDTRHFAVWHDPHPKPTYLFALVAGPLSFIEDQFVTASGRSVDIEFYTESKDHLDACVYAMGCLKRAMRWDEQKYGREYDLNRYMIVAVDQFCMGAMENKGLNIFNSKYVYAKPETATDQDFNAVESVIAHEYFHNWSGNRVTLRDWFQLSLKEGFTIFRDQQFSADMGSAAVQRIRDIHMVKLHQFREDAGPTSHPVQPTSYLTIDNFYTITVYNKGAELIRMLYLLLGAQKYRAATDLYFDLFDGKAATVNDFVRCIEKVSGLKLEQFRRWYSIAGTPHVTVERQYNADLQTYTLTFQQEPSNHSEQIEWQPMHIPIQMALLDQNGDRLPLKLSAEQNSATTEMLLQLTEPRQSFEFLEMPSNPVPSIFRGFSAPVIVHDQAAQDEVYFMMANEDDPYCLWNACQRASKRQVYRVISGLQNNRRMSLQEEYLNAFESLLNKAADDPEFTALVLDIPSEISIGQTMDVVAPTAINEARRLIIREIASNFYEQFLNLYDQLTGKWGDSTGAVGKRSLRNLCLSYLIALDTPTVHGIALDQFAGSTNMTDRAAALTSLVNSNSPAKESVLRTFYSDWHHDSGVIDKWFRIQATASRSDTIDRVLALTNHQAFTLQVPNRIYSLIGAFCHANPCCFHAKDGTGYDLLMKYVLKVDKFIPQASAQLAEAFSEIGRQTEERQAAMYQRLQKIASTKGVSVNVYEIVDRILSSVKPSSQELKQLKSLLT